jgi:hypothetical protein
VTETDLPREAHQEPLDYNRLVSTLDMIDGEPVIVRLASREADNESTAGVASIVGKLKHQVPARYEGHEFSIGSPYPDRNPERLAGGASSSERRPSRARRSRPPTATTTSSSPSRRAAWRSSLATAIRPTRKPGSDGQVLHVNLAGWRESLLVANAATSPRLPLRAERAHAANRVSPKVPKTGQVGVRASPPGVSALTVSIANG